MEQIYNPGICEVTKALITPYSGSEDDARDITGMIAEVSFQQSIGSVSFYGTLKIIDNIGFLERTPLRGEEDLDLVLKCYDIQTVREIKARIYKIDDVVPTQAGNGNMYTLHFLSRLSFNANLKYFISAYRDVKGSTAALDVFKKKYSQVTVSGSSSSKKEVLPEKSVRYKIKDDSERSFYLQETDGKIRAIIPRLAPSEAMTFIAERAFSKTNPSSSFRFFETWDGYYFVTDEWLHEKARLEGEVASFDYVQFGSKEPENAKMQISTLDMFSNPRRVDVASEMMGGSYYNTFIEVDLLRHTSKRYDYEYLKTQAEYIKQNPDDVTLSTKEKISQNFKATDGSSANADSDIHSRKFVKDTFNRDNDNGKRFMIIRDYTQKESGSGLSKDETFYRQQSAFRNMYSRHLNATRVNIEIKGRLDLSAGQVININVRELDSFGQAISNKQLSGRYLIQTISSKIEGGVLTTACQICKYDWIDAGDRGGEI